METEKYTGVLAEIIELVRDAGEPPDIRLIKVTREEMDEIVHSHAFRTTVSKYYGDSSTMVFNTIEADHEGNVISMYLNHLLIAVGAADPTGPLAEITYPPVDVTNNSSTTFVKDGNLLVGTGNPANGMVVGTNKNIELALAVRKANDATNYGDAQGHFNIPLTDAENWSFVVSVGSKHAEIPKVTDMYTVKLYLDVNPAENQYTHIVWELRYIDGFIRGNPVKNYVWFHNNEPVVFDGAINEEQSVTQTIQKYSFLFISQLIPSYVKRNEQGAPMGKFTLRLEAVPKYGTDLTPAIVEALANISKKQ